MRTVTIARNAELKSHNRLVEAAERRGHTLDIVNTHHCFMNITSRCPRIRYRGEKLVGYGPVIPRIGAPVAFYGLAVLRQFEILGVHPLAGSVATGRSRDKLYSFERNAKPNGTKTGGQG